MEILGTNESFELGYHHNISYRTSSNCNDFSIAYEVPMIICSLAAVGIGIFFTFFGE